MSNLQHGFYSTNTAVNPDCTMIQNIEIKKALLNHQKDIRDVVNGKIVGVGVTDLVVYLIDCALPHAEHLLEKKSLDTIYDYYHSQAFSSIKRSIEGKTLSELICRVSSYR
jgi:methylaspartate ammonia-lyase